MTVKGKMIREKIKSILERNKDGITVMSLKEIIGVSRNSIYKYLTELENEKVIKKENNKWFLSRPIKPKTIPGYQYQAILEGFKDVDPEHWDISTKTGRKNYIMVGHSIYDKLKYPEIDIERLKNKLHKFDEILEISQRMMKEAVTGETDVEIKTLISESGYPDPDNRLAALITFEGGYVASEPVKGNGFAHYYILAGVIEAFIEKIIISIYGGRCKVKVINKKFEDDNQSIDLGVFIIFDKKTPFIDPYTGLESDFEENFPYDY
jgi:predicted Zn-ribbon and HTH transcriptional regulator